MHQHTSLYSIVHLTKSCPETRLGVGPGPNRSKIQHMTQHASHRRLVHVLQELGVGQDQITLWQTMVSQWLSYTMSQSQWGSAGPQLQTARFSASTTPLHSSLPMQRCVVSAQSTSGQAPHASALLKRIQAASVLVCMRPAILLLKLQSSSVQAKAA